MRKCPPLTPPTIHFVFGLAKSLSWHKDVQIIGFHPISHQIPCNSIQDFLLLPSYFLDLSFLQTNQKCNQCDFAFSPPLTNKHCTLNQKPVKRATVHWSEISRSANQRLISKDVFAFDFVQSTFSPSSSTCTGDRNLIENVVESSLGSVVGIHIFLCFLVEEHKACKL